MMMLSKHALTDAFCGFFREAVEVTQLTQSSWRVSMPVMDEHNDPIELDIRAVDGAGIVLTDGGYLHREIALKSTQEDESAPVWDHVRTAANRMDLRWGGGYLWTEASSLAEAANSMLLMADAINLGLQASTQYVSPVQVQFWEEIMLFFDDADIPYKRNERLAGVSQVRHRVDFALQNGNLHAVQAIASEASMRRSLNIFYDILEAQPTIVPISIVDDAKSGYSNETFEQLAYKTQVYLWRDRYRFADYWHSVAHR